jgi:hypothetical protein
MPRRLLRRLTARFQPAIDRVTGSPAVRRYAPALADPDLWYLNRRSTARAVASGLACGLIPGPLQVPAVIGCSLAFRANLPLAIVTTFYTNPLTIVPLYLVAYEYGALFIPGAPRLGHGVGAFERPADAGVVDTARALADWMLGLGAPLGLGLVLLAATLAAAGWIAVRLAWRASAIGKWRRRAQQRRTAA